MRVTRRASLLLVGLLLAFVGGVVVGHYEVPPYRALSALKNRLPMSQRLGPWLAEQRGDTEQVDVVMLGDSLTAYGDWAALLQMSSVANHGRPGITSGAMLARLDETVQHRPRVVVIMAGVNDLLNGMPVAMVELNVTFAAASLKAAGITPVVQSVLLMRDRDDLNASILDVNARLHAWCRKQDVMYVDLNAALARGRALDPQVTIDGLHLNAEGYRRWSAAIAPLVAPFRSSSHR